MKRMLLLPAILLSLALAGCAGTNVGTFVKAATTTIVNPVDSVDIYRVKNVYAGTLELGKAWREYCWSKPYAALMADRIARPLCQNRRETLRRMQAHEPKAFRALITAENFVAANPTLNAASLIAAAWRAVTDFQKVVPNAI